MQSNTLNLISGAYTNILWESLEDVFTNEDSPSHIHHVLTALHNCGNDKAAFALIRILYDVTGLELPDVVEKLDGNDEIRSVYISDLLVDIENIV